MAGRAVLFPVDGTAELYGLTGHFRIGGVVLLAELETWNLFVPRGDQDRTASTLSTLSMGVEIPVIRQ